MNRFTPTNRGYTLLELLVVIVIASLLVGIAIPAFRAILSSSRRSLAESKLQQAMYSARDAATASVGGGDAAAVFFFEPGRGVSVLTCIEVGSIEDEVTGGITGPGGASGSANRRDVFVPVPGFEPVQLPNGIGVRGFALGTLFAGRSNWYESLDSRAGNRVPPEPGYWVFPETAFYPEDELDGGDVRQTFMVRFTAGEGTLSREPTRALVVSPSTSGDAAVNDLSSSINPEIDDIDEIDDLELWTKRALSNVSVSDDQRLALFGNASVHTVLAGPVTELALYEERDLSRALGARGLNQDTGTLYVADDREPDVDDRIYDGGTRLLARNASRWIEGRELIGTQVPQTDSTAQVFAVNAFFADLVEITR